MNRDLWLAAIRDAEHAELSTNDDALTVREYAALAQCGRDLARRRLNQTRASGLAVKVQKRYRGTDGRPQFAPAYRLVHPTPSDPTREG